MQRVGGIWFTVALLGFLLNYGWELAQMPAFTDEARQPFDLRVAEAMRHCLVPTLGDVLVVISTFALGTLIHGHYDWIRRLGWRDVLLVSIPLVLLAVVIEFVAVDRLGRWHYSRLMPVIPVVEVGLLPTIQLAFLTVLTLAVSGWLVGHLGRVDQHCSSQARQQERAIRRTIDE